MTGAILGATASPGSFSLPSVFADAGGLSSSGAGGLSSSGAGGLPSSGAGGLPSSGAGGPPSSGAGGLPLSGAALAAVAAGEQAIIDPRLPRDHVENASHGTPARPSPEALALARSLRREHPPATTPEASLTPASTPAAATETASILLAANDFSDGKAPLPESTGSSPAAADTAAAAATATAASDAASDATAAAAADAATAKAASDAATAKAASAHAAVATATTPATTNATAPDAASAATRSPASPATPALRPALAAPAKDSPADAAARDAGSTTPGLTPDAPSADTLVAGSDRQNADNDFSASFPKAAIADRVEAWRRAWQSGLLDAYMGFYAPDAVQGRRKGATEIRRQKRRVWTDAAPADVALDDIRIRVKKDIVIAEMRQRYADKNGNGDVGLKRLTFKQSNGVWLITQEDWSPLPHEIGN